MLQDGIDEYTTVGTTHIYRSINKNTVSRLITYSCLGV